MSRIKSYHKNILDAFEENFIPEPNSGCWLWTGPIFKLRGGYGCFNYGTAVMQRAHRTSWKLYRDPWLDRSAHILHRCDNPVCVNPDHLFTGDQASNMYDKSMKGRQLQKEHHPHFKHGLYIGDKKNHAYP